jgi:hypothetical protein
MVEWYYSISDEQGLIGVFTNKNSIDNIINEYKSINFLVQKFKIHEGQRDFVWTILHKISDYVLYVSNDKKDVDIAYNTFNKMGLCYENIDYYRIPINSIHEDKKSRLDISNKAFEVSGLDFEIEFPNIFEYQFDLHPFEKNQKDQNDEDQNDEKISILSMLIQRN